MRLSCSGGPADTALVRAMEILFGRQPTADNTVSFGSLGYPEVNYVLCEAVSVVMHIGVAPIAHDFQIPHLLGDQDEFARPYGVAWTSAFPNGAEALGASRTKGVLLRPIVAPSGSLTTAEARTSTPRPCGRP